MEALRAAYRLDAASVTVVSRREPWRLQRDRQRRSLALQDRNTPALRSIRGIGSFLRSQQGHSRRHGVAHALDSHPDHDAFMMARNRCLAFVLLVAGGSLGAQSAPAPEGATKPEQPAPAPKAPAASPLNFSGVIFGSYNYLLPTTPNPLRNQANNSFVVDRAYLNFRIAAGERTSIRITTDVFQSADSTSNAYTVRAKYAYLQYEAPKMAGGAQMTGRVGILQNVVIDHTDTFWPRYLSQAATERAGFFSSADVGIAGLLTLPNKWGEAYATIVNGPGYATRERDRFKDFAVRLSLTPFMNGPSSSLLQSFTITAWGYKGATASSFVNGGVGQVGAVGEALDRSRAGVFVGIRDPKLTLGAELARRHEEGETGQNTVLAPRVGTETTGRLLSGFAVVRPFAFGAASGRSPIGVVARYDHVKPTVKTSGFASPPAASNAYHNLIAGVFLDISQRAQLALDYQESLASDNGLSNAPPSQSKGYYAHFVVNF
jgi:hypothetical protein